MDKMDMKLVVHCAVELAVVGGLSVLFWRKTSALEKRLEELEKQNQYLFQVLQSMAPPPPKGRKGAHSSQERPPQGPPSRGQGRAPPREERTVQFEQEPEDEEEFSEGDLDDIVDEELECEGGVCKL